MKTEKTINLTAYVVEYIDQREPKPRPPSCPPTSAP